MPNVATARGGVCHKSSVVERGADLGGWLAWREVIGAEKSLKSYNSGGWTMNKTALQRPIANGSWSIANRKVVMMLVLRWPDVGQ